MKKSEKRSMKRDHRGPSLRKNPPIADLAPHNANLASPGWKRPIQKIQVKGEPLSDTTTRLRAEER